MTVPRCVRWIWLAGTIVWGTFKYCTEYVGDGAGKDAFKNYYKHIHEKCMYGMYATVPLWEIIIHFQFRNACRSSTVLRILWLFSFKYKCWYVTPYKFIWCQVQYMNMIGKLSRIIIHLRVKIYTTLWHDHCLSGWSIKMYVSK